jgi:hypothetical protein
MVEISNISKQTKYIQVVLKLKISVMRVSYILAPLQTLDVFQDLVKLIFRTCGLDKTPFNFFESFDP